MGNLIFICGERNIWHTAHIVADNDVALWNFMDGCWLMRSLTFAGCLCGIVLRAI